MEILTGNLYFVSDDFLQRYKTLIWKLIMKTQSVRIISLLGTAERAILVRSMQFKGGKIWTLDTEKTGAAQANWYN